MNDPEPSGSARGELRKGLGGVPGQPDYCDNPNDRCTIGEGDCDSSAQCAGGSSCVADMGGQWRQHQLNEVCAPAHCTDRVNSGDEPLGSIDCGGSCGACTCNPTLPQGDGNRCLYYCKCDAGLGDCDSDSDCTAGNVCVQDVGFRVGITATHDVCFPAHCRDRVLDFDETATDCGGSCGACTCAGQRSITGSECTAGCPCSDGEGDCDSNADCATGLLCREEGATDRCRSDGSRGSITVAPISGLITNEAGATASFTIVLGVPPSGDVTVALSSSDPGEGTTSAPSVTFTNATWDVPQTIVVTGINDGVADYDASYSIITAPAASTDPRYNGLDADDVQLTNQARIGIASLGAIPAQLPPAGWSNDVAASPDGRFVAYASDAANLVVGDTNNAGDIFVYDRQTNAIDRVSVSSQGVQGDRLSFDPSISADGRFVVFTSEATNLVSGDSNGRVDVFLHDRQTRATTRVSVSAAGQQGSNESRGGRISSDGRFIAFHSMSQLIPGDGNGSYADVFVRDRVSGQLAYASVSSAGLQGFDDSENPSISADGRFVAFRSDAPTLVPGDSNGRTDVFWHDMLTGETRRVSVSSAGAQSNNNSDSAAISGDGQVVAFRSSATNLDASAASGIFTHELATGLTVRASADYAGGPGNGVSFEPSISQDGRFVAFRSLASNLVPGDSNGYYDVFVRDRQLGTTARASVSSAGGQGTNDSSEPVLSADGRLVFFLSLANDLVAGDASGKDIFIHDLVTHATSRLLGPFAGIGGDQISSFPSLSSDGRFVAFSSFADNLVDGDANGRSDVFVHDRLLNLTTIASVSSSGLQGNGHSEAPSLSADARYVAFRSLASNLVSGDSNGAEDVFVHDRQTGATVRASVSTAGAQAAGGSTAPVISANGRFVAFVSTASNLVGGDVNGASDVFIRDLDAGRTVCASVDAASVPGNGISEAPSLSADGRTIAFHSTASNLIPGDGNARTDVFVRDLSVGETTRASVATGGAQANNHSYQPAISADGRVVAFESSASNLVAGDSNGLRDIFRHDRQTGVTIRVSVTAGGVQGDRNSFLPVLSADGRFIAFVTSALSLLPGDTNGADDVCLYDYQSGALTRGSAAPSGAQAVSGSNTPAISGDGRWLSFQSGASNLAPGDTNGVADIFVAPIP